MNVFPKSIYRWFIRFWVDKLIMWDGIRTQFCQGRVDAGSHHIRSWNKPCASVDLDVETLVWTDEPRWI